MKKFSIISVIMIVIMGIVITGCSSDKNDENKTEAEKITFGENVAAVAGDYEITKDEVDMYISMYIPYIQQRTGADEGWENILLDDGKTAKDTLIDFAIKEAKYQKILHDLVKSKGMYTDADDEAFYLEYIEENGGVEEYNAFLAEYGISEEAFRGYVSSVGAYYAICSEEEADEIYNNDFITAKHILIQFEGRENEEAAYNEAMAAYNRAIAGENFEDLIIELNEDPGEDPDTGYTFGEGEMVDEFYQGALNLEIKGISEPIRTDYGYHVIKRYPNPEKGTDLYDSYIYNIMNNEVTKFVNGEEMNSLLEANVLHINEDMLNDFDFSKYTLNSEGITE